MKKKKSESRKVAELVARQRNIKVRSAQSWLARIASGKVKKPKYDLTSYAKRKVAKFVKAEKVRRSEPKAIKAIPVERPKRIEFQRGATVAIKATFDFYGTDKRHRTINLQLSASELNKLMNADNAAQGLQTLQKAKQGSFLASGDIYDLDFISIDGRRYDEDFFD